jgi:hypothetical protein
VGIVLLILAGFLAYSAIKLKPEETSTLLRVSLFSSLVGGMIFSAAGPALALFWVSQSPIPKVPLEKAFDYLETNEKVAWLIRLIPFDQQTDPELAVGRLVRLGPLKQQYSFVAPYEELAGY